MSATPDMIPDDAAPHPIHPDDRVPEALRPRNVRQLLGEGAGVTAQRALGMVLRGQQEMAAWVAELASGPREAPGAGREHMTTQEAAAYLNRSVSWLLKRNDIPFVKGAPNTYRRRDLDDWAKRNLVNPRIG
ncbi:helix-turn-helix domain-containing protein [Verrucomicrobiota bacterium]